MMFNQFFKKTTKLCTVRGGISVAMYAIIAATMGISDGAILLWSHGDEAEC